jgi:hypothetical protein
MILQYKWSLFTGMGEIIQNGMIDKIKLGIFNFDLILSITINVNIFHNITIYSNMLPQTQGGRFWNL